MLNPLQKIVVKGKEVELLLTPSLYRVCKERGWVIESSTDLADIEQAYIRLLYAAAINANQVRRFDDSSIPELDITLMDMQIWSFSNPSEFVEMIKKAIELLSGKSVEQLAKEEEKKEEKKKRGSRLSAITRLLRRS
jgi:hypothetical protein